MDKSVREYLQTRLRKDLSGYKIDRISDIHNPHDNTVADQPFRNFQSAKHQLVVKLHTRI